MLQHLKYLEQQRCSIEQAIQAVVNQESPTSSKQCCDRTAEWIQDLFVKNLDCTASIMEQTTTGNSVLVEWGHGPKQILIVGHFDTVHPLGTLKDYPFHVQDGKIYGPGIYDMKCGIIQALFALKSLEEHTQVKSAIKVKCYFNSDEEIGSPESRFAMLDLGRESQFAFVMEPSFGAQGALKTARRGVGAFKITAHGRAAHAGNCPEEGISAIEEVCHQVLTMQALNDPEKGIHVNCGLINGGTARNTIPEFAQAAFDVRVDTAEAAERFKREFHNLLPVNPKVQVSCEGDFTRPPMERNRKQQELFLTAQKLMWDCCGESLTQASVGGASDGNILSAVTTVLDGMGAVGGHAHSPHEFVFERHIIPRTALLAALLERV